MVSLFYQLFELSLYTTVGCGLVLVGYSVKNGFGPLPTGMVYVGAAATEWILEQPYGYRTWCNLAPAYVFLMASILAVNLVSFRSNVLVILGTLGLASFVFHAFLTFNMP